MEYLGTDISPDQRSVHIGGELTAMLLVTPYLLYLSQKPQMKSLDRAALAGIGLGTLAIDGWLLSQWMDRSGAVVKQKLQTDVAPKVVPRSNTFSKLSYLEI